LRLSTKHLRGYCSGPLPSENLALRELLDDVGVEVKRIEDDGAVFSVELLANRGDHRCYAGIAREMVGRVGGAVQLPPITALELGGDPIELRLETELCLVYTATRLEIDDVEQDFPAEVLIPLLSAGLQPVNAAVDATNLVNLEIGQPTHLFDAETIVGPITIREARPGETALPLFHEKRVEVPAGAMVIADDEKILAIAGVIGCEESKVTASTRQMILESACFDPVAVRKAGRALNIFTDSSARFERGSDPSLPLIGAGRVVQLLEAHAGARRVGSSAHVGAWTNPSRSVAIEPGRASAWFHHPMTATEITERLERYDFQVRPTGEALEVVVPAGRLWDVENPEDIYEELAKSIGYNTLPEAMPAHTIGVRPSPAQELRSRIEEVLLGAGFYETITDGFYGRSLAERLLPGADHPLWKHVETVNSLDKGYSLLKNNCLAQALLGLSSNIRMGLKQIRLFEFTRTFHPDPNASNGLCTERHVLWLLAHGSQRDPSWADHAPAADAMLLKGLVEELGTELGCTLSLERDAAKADPTGSLLHPARRAAILYQGVRIGVMGEVDPTRVAAMGMKKARPCYLELDLKRLNLAADMGAFVPPSLRPLSTRSLAFSLAPRIQAAEVLAVMQAAGPEWLEAIDITDLFAFEEEGVEMRAITFALRFRNDESELSTEMLNATTEELATAVLEALGDRGVAQRS
jgi:phenylalanyl-tRNA synthetase beta chain